MTDKEASQLKFDDKLGFKNDNGTNYTKDMDYITLMQVDGNTIQGMVIYSTGRSSHSCWFYCKDLELRGDFPEDDYDVFECK